ncbi:bifunctional diaminohydroxyphosphoribosylaminopyrimidine deaminase/5-amino-6-(5-phosphoribosylamino)uracil reductase RibD [Rheinheimera tangshanensis]|uniref:Riboflavin biosynthesis protein RibD n=1 Tax=Rheinheimera tangshanensis TaxID=400153 RepID=A0A5C8LZL8_9GAMM|nr:bifunctional diaminohydroxyphosphoribosylaminopyrimidine deaminase/5-amino-6-(5-phosphoribosylamino)uracil reductase RibD [Rheinheimera tangshanensis]TXK81663.1 bifunctional diaminohydroxyphosphoribosylaminopyrimidine deaminase/5-amino-6-(5-phosphoribosylamino)uracil reductase RibD [Rheinheimera tangshanensis]GGM56195.1 riboflavin biosynthesis protein RibD [Rheinheimera tangshanensis]
MSFSELDKHYMARAIELAAQGRFTTAPNPNVGSVIVRDGEIVGEGYHRQAGGPHAEVFALRQAEHLASGATCYVTLEPCSHYGRTGPCALALVNAGVKKVVVAMLDPNPLVAGRGIQILQDAGIEVQVGLLEEQARALNPGFLSRMERQKPYIRLKLATSLDGRIALANGKSQWISSPESRSDVQLMRAQAHAILSTATTVLADNARLTVRPEGLAISRLEDGSVRQPIRVILDRSLKLTGRELLFSQNGPIVLVHDKHYKPRFENPQVRFIAVDADELGLNLSELMPVLASENINDLWVEAGAVLAGSLWQAGLVDELIIYQAPVLLGDKAKAMLQLPNYSELCQAQHFVWTSVERLGPDLKLTARLEPCLPE